MMQKLDPVEAIEKGIAVGIREMGERFQRFEIFLPHLVLASDATTDAMKVLVAAIPEDRIGLVKRGRIVVGTVEGDLHEGYHVVDLVKACFPGGSITGAPKIRAMQIIDELEPTKRSVYTGAIGYIGADENMDINIAIRTFIVNRDRAFFQVGGGIVADSEPESEYDETLDKARALIESVSR